MNELDYIADLAAELESQKETFKTITAGFARRPGMNHTELAKAAGISRQTLYTWIAEEDKRR